MTLGFGSSLPTSLPASDSSALTVPQEVHPGDLHTCHTHPFVAWSFGSPQGTPRPLITPFSAPDKLIHIQQLSLQSAPRGSRCISNPNLSPVPTSLWFQLGCPETPPMQGSQHAVPRPPPISSLEIVFDVPHPPPHALPITPSAPILTPHSPTQPTPGSGPGQYPGVLLLRRAAQIVPLLSSQAPPSLHRPGRHMPSVWEIPSWPLDIHAHSSAVSSACREIWDHL